MKDTNKTKKKLEEALKAERDKLKNILDAMDDCVYIINKDFYIEYANPVLERGFGPAEGVRCVEYFGTPDTEQSCPCHRLLEPISKEEIRGRSEWYSPKNQKTYDVFQTPITNEDGSETYLQIMHDITEKKKAEVEFERIFNLSPDMICIVSATDGYFKRLNPAWEALLGYTREELFSRPFLKFIHYDDRGPTMAEVEKQLQGQSTICFENRYRCKDGSYKILEWRAHAVEGGLIYGAARDITDRRHAEEALQALVASSVGSIGQEFFERITGSLYEWLNVDCAIVGELADEEEVKALSMRLDGESVEGYSYALSGTPCEHVSERGFCVYPEGVSRLFHDDEPLVRMGAEGYVGVPLRDGDGNTLGILCAISRRRLEPPSGAKEVLEIIAARASVEIERKQVGEALDAKAMELDRTNKDLHNLAMEMTMLVEKERKRCAGLLHDDIGQNLVAARLVFSSFSKLCDRCSDTARETMDEANSLLESTINRVRAIASDLHPAHPYGEELVSKKGLKDAVAWYAKTVLVQPGVELAVDIDGAVEEMPEDFKQNLYLIVQECFQNVMKHSLASSVELRCKVDKERLRFSVKDDGVGFDDIRLKKSGGVGLRLMRERVRSMNGVLTIKSEPDKGTEVLAEFLRR